MTKKWTVQEAREYAEKYAEDDVTVTIVDAETIRLSDGVAYKTISLLDVVGKRDLRAEVKSFTSCD